MESDANGQNTASTETVKQFRKNLSDILTPDVSDAELRKWLRAKNFHLKKSEELYRTNIRIRSVFRVDEIEKIWHKPEVIEKYEFANDLGVAKDGTPIRYIALGRGDLKGFIMGLDTYDIAKYCCNELERDKKRCREQSNKLGKEIHQVTYIMDMDGFNVRHYWFSGVLEIGLDLFRMLQDHYPEIWKNVFIVNAPCLFHYVFGFFKPILRFNILEKINIVSREQTANILLKHVDDDVLPAFLGGKRVDSTGDPMCSEFMKFGGPVHEKDYLRNRTPLLPTDPGVEDVWIPPKCCHNIAVVVKEPKTVLRVEIRSEGGSIPGILLYRPLGPDPDNIDLPGFDEYLDPSNKKYNVVQCAPQAHIQSHVSPIDNCAYAPWPGIYIFRLDNSYNWLTGRRCLHRIQALPPGTNGEWNESN